MVLWTISMVAAFVLLGYFISIIFAYVLGHLRIEIDD